jgi:hypothetical protein
MRSRHGKRARLGGVLLAALGALALLALPSIAAAKDRNHDRIPDRWEKRHHLSLNVDQAWRDQDGDHLSNSGEFRAGDNPRDRDSDNDGVIDGDENAGTIASFDPTTGRLTITLFGGDTVSGVVDDETEIRCGHDRGDDSTASASRDGEDEDNSGPGNSGDDGDDPGTPPTPPTGTTPEQGGDNPTSDDGPGHDANDDGPQHEQAADCTSAALTAGTVVDEAELRLGNGVATFSEVELEQSSSAS